MNSFAHALGEVSAGLDLPVAVRERLLSELAGDLEGFRLEAISSGASAAEAVERALKFVDLGPEAVAELAKVHAAAPRRWLEGFSAVARSKGERVALVIVGLVTLQFAVGLAASGDVFSKGGALALCSIGVSFATVIAFAISALRYHFVGDHRSLTFHQWAGRLSVLAGLQVALSVTGIAAHAWKSFSALSQGPAPALNEGAIGQNPDIMAQLQMLMQTTALLSLTGLGVLLTALLWRRTTQRASALELAEAALLSRLLPDQSTTFPKP